MANGTRTLLSEETYNRIREKIVSFAYPPGMVLTEEQLVKELNVSRTPIREALWKLQFDDLVDIVKNRGVFVRSLTVNETYNIFVVREALEGVNIRYTAASIDDDSLAVIDERLKKAGALFDQGDYLEANELSNRIHETIIEASGNRKVATLINALAAQIDILNSLGRILPGRAFRSHEQHILIYQALMERDGEAAERHMREHIVDTRDEIIASIRNKLR